MSNAFRSAFLESVDLDATATPEFGAFYGLDDDDDLDDEYGIAMYGDSDEDEDVLEAEEDYGMDFDNEGLEFVRTDLFGMESEADDELDDDLDDDSYGMDNEFIDELDDDDLDIDEDIEAEFGGDYEWYGEDDLDEDLDDDLNDDVYGGDYEWFGAEDSKLASPDLGELIDEDLEDLENEVDEDLYGAWYGVAVDAPDVIHPAVQAIDIQTGAPARGINFPGGHLHVRPGMEPIVDDLDDAFEASKVLDQLQAENFEQGTWLGFAERMLDPLEKLAIRQWGRDAEEIALYMTHHDGLAQWPNLQEGPSEGIVRTPGAPARPIKQQVVRDALKQAAVPGVEMEWDDILYQHFAGVRERAATMYASSAKATALYKEAMFAPNSKEMWEKIKEAGTASLDAAKQAGQFWLSQAWDTNTLPLKLLYSAPAEFKAVVTSTILGGQVSPDQVLNQTALLYLFLDAIGFPVIEALVKNIDNEVPAEDWLKVQQGPVAMLPIDDAPQGPMLPPSAGLIDISPGPQYPYGRPSTILAFGYGLSALTGVFTQNSR